MLDPHYALSEVLRRVALASVRKGSILMIIMIIIIINMISSSITISTSSIIMSITTTSALQKFRHIYQFRCEMKALTSKINISNSGIDEGFREAYKYTA